MPKHALLSPSSAERWLTCSPSARLEQQYEDRGSEYADEGTLAHKLGEWIIKLKLGLCTEKNFDAALNVIMLNQYYNESMYEYCEEYAVFVIGKFAEAKKVSRDAKIFLEKKFDLSRYIPESFGTGDVCIVADIKAYIIDLKYGKGVSVSAINNMQCRVYGLGALEAFGVLFDIHQIEVTIFQPRTDNITSDTYTVEDLKHWANTELKPKALKAFEGIGELIPGKHCRFCKVKATCKAFTNMNLELLKFTKLKNNSTLNDKTISDLLGKIDMFKEWIKSFEDYTLSEAIKGKKFPGWKLVEGIARRKYTDEKKIIKVLKKEGYDEELILSKPELLGITELTKVINKRNFDNLVTPYLIKPAGKPTLVNAEDKRPELNDISAAKQAFKDIEF